ncbi:MAG: hypothetical protein M3350_07760 [Actinomycetota bacterium]|nr:hypothetical protein [Actinomycetota bacterium]
MTRTATTKFVATALAVASLGVTSLGSAETADAATGARVSIQAQSIGFFGHVTSSKESCESGRKVVLFKQKGTKKNTRKDRKIGSDTAQPNGPDSMWSINTDESGKFYAVVKATKKCKKAVSKSVRSEN